MRANLYLNKRSIFVLLLVGIYYRQFLLSEKALSKWSESIESEEKTTWRPTMFLVYENLTNATFDLVRFQNNVQTWQNKATDAHKHVSVGSSSSSAPLFVLVVITVAAPTSDSLNDSAEVVQSLYDTIHDALTSPLAHVVVYLTKSHSHLWEGLAHTFGNTL